MEIENSLWVEKYRPSKLENYVGNPELKKAFEQAIKEQEIGNLCLFGPAGTGKTTAAKMLVKNIACDYMIINASDENNVETVRSKIKQYASSMSTVGYKVIILDESDFFSKSAQAILRHLIEQYSASTRFILTCNYIENLIPALLSRCRKYEVIPPSNEQIVERLKFICSEEKISYKDEDIELIVNKNYPDIRGCIETLQMNIFGGELCLNLNSLGDSLYLDKIWEIVKDNNNKEFGDCFEKVKQLLIDSKSISFQELYSYFYEHVEELKSELIPDALLSISEIQYKANFAVDKQIPAMTLISEMFKLFRTKL